MDFFLSDFRVWKPPYCIPQGDSLEWLAQAYFTSLKALDPLVSDKTYDVVLKKVQRFGCQSPAIEQRFTVLEDQTHTRWEDMEVFNLWQNPAGADLIKRTEYFHKACLEALSHLYVKDDKQPEGVLNPMPQDMIHVTCTGYYAPNALQQWCVQQGWEATHVVTAYHMGCYAAFTAIKMAMGFCAYKGQPHTTDVVHTELCSLNFNPTAQSSEQFVVQSLFADGCIRYGVSNHPTGPSGGQLKVLGLHTLLLPDSHQDMTWQPANSGFLMTLSCQVPIKIGAALKDFVNVLMAKSQCTVPLSRMHWAIHPGGPKIIQSVQEVLQLDEVCVGHSKAVLRQRGNMSSATLPHVWQSMVQDAAVETNSFIISLAFGPGLNIWGMILQKV